ncbi:MAG: extracellular solute-binding protein [Clostridiales bacterium]|jgi:multiple sugar transport system substrate-binding protein|nr:extracellular solute-binding protein [Clostridiales bacterium]
MKRLLSLITASIMVFSLTACTSANQAPEQTAAPAATAAQTPAAEVAPEPATDAPATDDAEQTEIRVVWWGGDTRHEITLKAIDLFEKANPNIKVSPEYMGSDSYWDKLATQVAGGSAPDVLQFGGNYPDYVAKDALLPLNGYFGNIIDISNIDKSAIDAATIDGNTYGLCLGTNILGIAFNRTMIEAAGVGFPEPGASWEDFEAYCLTLAPKLPEGTYPINDASGQNTNFIGFYSRQMGTNMYTSAGETKMTVETLKNFFDLWARWRSEGIIPGGDITAEYSEESTDQSTLVAGKVAMTLLYTNQIVSYQDAMTDELDIMPLPDMEKNAQWIMPSQYFCINKASKVQDAAAAFIDFFVNTPEVGLTLKNDRGISSNSEVRTAISAQATPIDQKVYNLYAVLADHTTPMDPNVPNDQEFTDGFKRISQEVAFGTKTTEVAAQEAFDFLNEMIAKK